MVIADGKVYLQPRERLRGAVRPLPAAAVTDGEAGKPFTRCPQWPEGDWLCISDPSGDFTGGLFTTYDLRFTSAKRHWADGTMFRNRYTGKSYIIRKGLLHKC